MIIPVVKKYCAKLNYHRIDLLNLNIYADFIKYDAKNTKRLICIYLEKRQNDLHSGPISENPVPPFDKKIEDFLPTMHVKTEKLNVLVRSFFGRIVHQSIVRYANFCLPGVDNEVFRNHS